MKLSKLKENIVKRKSRFVQWLLIFVSFVLVLTLSILFVKNLVNKYIYNGNSIVHLKNEWQKYNYQEVYEISQSILEKDPFNNTALIYHGYSAFFLSLSQTETSVSQSLIDESINSMRIALQNAKIKTVPQLEYMLGKAYFYKDSISSYHYYADLVIMYLNRASKDGYKAEDIPEYLGLSYASLGMTMESIAAFTKALLTRESDLLLLSIAEQYFNAGQMVASEQYLYRISQDCKDDKINEKAHLLLGKIYLSQKKYSDAEKEFLLILEKNENSADGYYGLGVIYESQGDLIKARSNWRTALKKQSNHPDALKKLSEYK